jgi:hypothetical protein
VQSTAADRLVLITNAERSHTRQAAASLSFVVTRRPSSCGGSSVWQPQRSTLAIW